MGWTDRYGTQEQGKAKVLALGDTDRDEGGRADIFHSGWV